MQLGLRPTLAVGILFGAGPVLAQDQVHKLLPQQLAPAAFYGLMVEAENGLVLVNDHSFGQKDRGRALVFDQASGALLQELKLPDAPKSNSFGLPFAMSGPWTLVASRKGSATHSMAPAVHVVDPLTGQELHQLVPPDEVVGSAFGSAISIHGDLALLGAPYDATNGSWAGAAYLIHIPTNTTLHKWIGSDTQAGDRFGVSVALSADRAAVGTHFHDESAGSVYLFDPQTGAELQELTGSAVHPGAYFGWALALRDDVLAVAAVSQTVWGTPGAGAVYLFDASTGEETHRVVSPAQRLNAGFGRGIDQNGTHLVVGEPGDPATMADLGIVYRFDVATGALLGSLEPEDNAAGDLFGWSVSLDSCDGIAVGSPWDDDLGAQTGSAYLFGPGDPPIGVPYCGPAQVNSSGSAATLRGEGCADTSDQRLILFAERMPPTVPGLFLVADQPGFVPLVGGGQGNLCLGGTVGRFPDVMDTGAAGVFELDVDLTNLPPHGHAVQPGETWYFQAWFRDLNPGPTSNLTDGLEVPFD